MASDEQHIMFIFPGQGSQYRGMGADLYRRHAAAKRIYDQASEVLGVDMPELSFEDPQERLNLTRYTQPALLTHSIACLEVFRELTGNAVVPALAGGHSLGEYSALVAAGALSFENALRLVQRRGELMGTHGEGEMLAFPLDLATVRLLAERHFCGIAGCNLPDQTVVGGRAEDLDRLSRDALERFPRKKPARLKTEGAFHTYYMVTAARHFRASLDSADIQTPGIRVLSNYTGGYHEPDPASIKARLFFQLFHPVNWIGCLETAMEGGIGAFIEFGGGIGSSPEPESKRPNLENILKKAMRLHEHGAQYSPAINAQSLEETVKAYR